jgi:hypothetical protein
MRPPQPWVGVELEGSFPDGIRRKTCPTNWSKMWREMFLCERTWNPGRHSRAVINSSFSTLMGYQCFYDVLLQGGWQMTLISQVGKESLYEVRAPAGG